MYEKAPMFGIIYLITVCRGIYTLSYSVAQSICLLMFSIDRREDLKWLFQGFSVYLDSPASGTTLNLNHRNSRFWNIGSN